MSFEGIPSGELASLTIQLRRFARAKVRDAQAADDLVQETFIAAMAAWRGFEGRSKLRTWLTAILQNKIIDHVRAARRHREVIVSESDRPPWQDGDEQEAEAIGAEAADYAADPSRVVGARQLLESLSLEIAALPERSARALVMTDLEGLDTGEVCDRLRLTPNNLWVVLHRARKHVRGRMQPQFA